MPIPIRPFQGVQESNDRYVDYSFLAQQFVKTEKKQVTASNKDAEILMKIWLEAESKGEKFVISSELGLSSHDITRLKTYGLISGANENLAITDRGKKVITVMALGEGNKFEKGKTDKNYLEILASMDKRGKSGYRIPKFCSNNSNSLNVKDAFKE